MRPRKHDEETAALVRLGATCKGCSVAYVRGAEIGVVEGEASQVSWTCARCARKVGVVVGMDVQYVRRGAVPATPGELAASLRSLHCPGCGCQKSPARSFCRACYFKLSPDERKDLYRLIGDGYAEAFRVAIDRLAAARGPARGRPS